MYTRHKPQHKLQTKMQTYTYELRNAMECHNTATSNHWNIDFRNETMHIDFEIQSADRNSEKSARKVVIRTCSNYNRSADFSDLRSNALNFEIDVHNFVSEIDFAANFQYQIATSCVIDVAHEHMFRVTPLVNRVSRCI